MGFAAASGRFSVSWLSVLGVFATEALSRRKGNAGATRCPGGRPARPGLGRAAYLAASWPHFVISSVFWKLRIINKVAWNIRNYRYVGDVSRCSGGDGSVDGGDDDDDDDDGDDVPLDDDGDGVDFPLREGISPADSCPPESSFSLVFSAHAGGCNLSWFRFIGIGFIVRVRDEEISSAISTKLASSDELIKIFGNISVGSSADSNISSDSDSVDVFDFIDRSTSICEVFADLYDGVTNIDDNQTSTYHQVYAIEEASRAEPETSEAFDNLGNPYVDPADLTRGCERLPFLDAYSGYNQIRLKGEDEVKTAFITPYVFCYRTMPFGLKNAGATYQRMMQKCLATQIGKNVQVYIEDVIITTKEGSTLIDDLIETFDNLDKFFLKLNPTKCSFGVPAGELLGFLVSARGIEANPKKIQAIVTMRKPTKLKEIQQLTGRVAALSRFVARLGERALPFYALIKQGEKFEWNEEADRAFEDLKRTISTPPILVAPKEKEPLLLYIAATPQVVSTTLVVEREEEGKLHGQTVFFLIPFALAFKKPSSATMPSSSSSSSSSGLSYVSSPIRESTPSWGTQAAYDILAPTKWDKEDHDSLVRSEDDKSLTDGESDLHFLAVGETEEESDDDSFSCDFTSSGEEGGGRRGGGGRRELLRRAAGQAVTPLAGRLSDPRREDDATKKMKTRGPVGGHWSDDEPAGSSADSDDDGDDEGSDGP
ncbi:hypothetical protein QYE76_066009 [Lolium multiflorum]|uniref:Reverse transcriptase domain-containing protein n=1 Tax=Lolium multiflorum TaxID=4521 RepID=A0AAD8SAH1_LOLMU|nr:hypothetical protein QYE76_066009 [Lolium multiflorum]